MTSNEATFLWIMPGSGQYVFINLFAGRRGQAWSYAAAYDLVIRLRARTGLDFDPYWFRHSAATQLTAMSPSTSCRKYSTMIRLR